MKFPKKIYVHQESSGKDNWLIASKKKEEVEDGECAIYILESEAVKKTVSEIKIK